MGCAAPTPRGRPWLEETCFENCPGASCTTSLGQGLRGNVVNSCPALAGAPGRDNKQHTFSMFLLAVFLHGRGGVRRGEAGREGGRADEEEE